MYNCVMLVGRLTKDVVIQEKEKATITLACQREFKNSDGKYDTDFIDITVLGFLANFTKEHFHKGDMLSVKGRLVQDPNGQCYVVGEKIISISPKKEAE